MGGLIDLEQRLRDEGHSFKDIQELLTHIHNDWFAKVNSTFSERWNAPVNGFPTSRIALNNVEYNIHSLQHGERIILPIAENVRTYVQQHASSFVGPEEDYFCEHNMARAFGLDRSKQFYDFLMKGDLKPPIYAKIGACLALPLQVIGRYAMPLLAKRLKPVDFHSAVIYCFIKGASDIEMQEKSHRFYVEGMMPQPLEAEFQYVVEKSSRLIRALHKSIGGLPTGPQRSLWMAQQLLEKGRSLKKVHYFCGAGHVTQILYFLEHPNYSFKHLDEHFSTS